jgi:hypothetical protein
MELISACRAVDSFFFDYQVPVALPAIMRIATCLAILYTFAARIHDTWQFLQPNGLFSFADFQNISREFPQLTLTNLFPESSLWAACILVTLFVSGTLALVGCVTGISTWMFLLCVVSVQSRTLVVMYSGGDSIARTLLFFLALTDSSAWMSVDLIWRADRPVVVSGWGIRVIQFYLCFVYFWSSIHKLHCPHWLCGDAIENALKSPIWSRNSQTHLLRHPRILRLATRATLFFEFFAPLAFFANGVSALWMCAGLALHAGIWRNLRIGYFSPLMMAGLLSFSGPLLRAATPSP